VDDEPYLAWCLNQAVSWYGHWIEAKLDEQEPIERNGVIVGTKPRWRIGQLLDTDKPHLPTGDELLAALS
jgi:hypothetical protein